MKGILTDNLEADSDVIVTAVFLGLALQSGKGLQVSVDPTEAGKKLPDLEKTMARVNAALRSLNPKHTDVKAIKAPDHKPGKYITGGLKTVLNVETFKDFLEDGKVEEQYLGPGAYTGMVLLNNELKYWGSTFEHSVKTKRKFGKSLGSDLGAMHREANGKGVNGYVHGMIQAMYVAAHYNSIAKAKVIELAVGNTIKLASCFGCTTFMIANLRQPSHIHLGRAESWAPADPNNDFALEQLTGHRCTNDLNAKPDEMKKDVERLNKQWQEQVSIWLSKGAELSADFIRDEAHKASWEKLQKKYKGKPMPVGADDFLDALGAYHGHDATRIDNTLADPKK